MIPREANPGAAVPGVTAPGATPGATAPGIPVPDAAVVPGAGADGRRRWPLSLRARLLAGLIVLTACFLVVMGTVSSVVLGRLEHNRFDEDLRLAARQPTASIAKSTDGFAAAYLSLRTGATGDLTPASPTADQLRDVLAGLAGQRRAEVLATIAARAGRYQPFTISPGKGGGAGNAANTGGAGSTGGAAGSTGGAGNAANTGGVGSTGGAAGGTGGAGSTGSTGGTTLRAAWRLALGGSLSSGGDLPPGENVILIGRPVSAMASQVHGLVTAELITGGALLALLVVCGSWLIGRGLSPLDRMAHTADLITGSGDLTARMPGADGRQETGRLAAAINTMLDRIQHAFRARLESEQKVRQFAADASHELRTPLTTIRGYAELYRQGALGPGELPNAMRRIEQEADRMSMLVAELLELARLDRASSLDLTETDLAALARDAVADARAVEPGRPVTADVPPSLVVTADEPRIRQVLANLLGNVRAHTPPGTPAAVRVYRADGGVALEVADDGPGMPERDAAMAFNRFYRGSRAGGQAPEGAAPGSGLGLAIVQAIAAAHGGYARLRSAPGRGTAVQLWIPPERIVASPPAPARSGR